MNSRERVLQTVLRGKPDRLAIDFRAVPEVYDSLRAYLGCATNEEVNVRLHSDVRDLYKTYGTYAGPAETLTSDTWVNFWGIPYARSVDAFGAKHWVVKEPPLGAMTSVNEVRQYRWPRADWWNFDIHDVLDRLEESNASWISLFGSSIFGRACELRGMERAFYDMAEENEIIDVILDQVTEFFIAMTERALSAAQGRIHMIESLDDYGTQRGLLMSGAMFRAYIKPRLKRYNDVVKKHGLVVYHHTCGSIFPLIDDLLDAGVQVLDPLQFSARGMDPGLMVKTYGDRLTFHGGIDIQQVVPRLATEEMLGEARRVVDVMSQRRGYIFAGTHCFQADASPEKIVALFDFAHEYRGEHSP
jgi:uroporphyrinogen decarboxylase